MFQRDIHPDRGVLGLIAAALLGGLLACQPQTPEPAPPPPPPPPPPATAPPPPAAAQSAAPAPGPKVPPPIVVKDAGLMTPESVLHVADEDVYLVSNINGKPTDGDNNGFISKVSPDGKVVTLKWIEGGQNDVKLSAPKGMAVAGDTLYVTDIKTVRLFELKTGKPKGRVGVGGATFLNDLAVGPDSKLYFSDTGLKAGDKDLEPTGTDAVWRIGQGVQATQILRDKKLDRPNGLAVTAEGIWVVTQTGQLYRLTAQGKIEAPQKLPKGQLDGVVALPDGRLLVSSWEAGAVFAGKPGGEFQPIITGLKAPADIGFDAKRGRVLIPLFLDNALQFHTLEVGGAAAEPAAGGAKAAEPAAAKPAAAGSAAPAPKK
jgi:sugar lactone lactonase YvrE